MCHPAASAFIELVDIANTTRGSIHDLCALGHLSYRTFCRRLGSVGELRELAHQVGRCRLTPGFCC